MRNSIRIKKIEAVYTNNYGIGKSLQRTGASVKEVCDNLDMDMNCAVIKKELNRIHNNLEQSTRSADEIIKKMKVIAVYYSSTEKEIVNGAKDYSGTETDTAHSKKKPEKDDLNRIFEMLGIEIDNFNGVPDWMEAIGWLNRLGPWSWIFYRATKEGWLDELFDAVDFERGSDGIFHVNTDKYDNGLINKLLKDHDGVCWQQMGGYTEAYDAIFDVFCDMDADSSLRFKTNSGTEYTLWKWKGEYLNLGAGGELGIYKGDGDIKECAVNDELKITMHIDYGDGTSSDWSDETWWCTSFNPEKQHVRAEDISIIYKVDFSDADPEIWKGFSDMVHEEHPEGVVLAEDKTAYIYY